MREHTGLPLSTDPLESRNASLWVVAGMSALALAVVFHLKLDPAAARARNAADQEKQPTPAAAEVDDPTGVEQVTPPKTAEPRAQPPAQESAAKAAAAAPSASTAPSAAEPISKPARKSKRASEELQRLRRALTDAANRGLPATPETTIPAVEEAPAPVPTLTPAPARSTAIPENPY